MSATPTPAVGQVWQDNDPRQDSRQVRIVELTDTHALVTLVQPRNPVSSARAGRRTRIRLDRFRPISTGYRYVRTEATP
ncbi:DUF6354 family protein [Streptomyces rubiginosohelvolus]|uniref:Uncharacterized protein n=1 Tax=Streptomyces rubiginosohelvolus TaxID=67362 RepID=A0ABQ3CC16_9ACTN|nr:DUF6354 family protein [Streptomyces pluricolorescens]GGZ83173.1 hypothetical protein GCM10010328_66930 [Streptomyces pluricolorescens]